MGLGLPLALLGLVALGIPLWLHRMRRRTGREQRLPTLVLLQRAQAEDERPVRFHDLPLLLARLLVLALLALALAQPHLWTEDPVVGSEPVALACVIDDSLSMLRDASAEELFDEARDRARSVLAGLPAGSEVAVVLAGAPARVVHGRDADVQMAIDTLGAYEPKGARTTDLDHAVALARDQLAGSALREQRVWVLSDCAETSAAAQLAASDANLWLQCVGRDAREDNAYLESLSLTPSGSDPANVQLTVDVRSTLPEQTLPVEVRSDDRTLARGEVEIADHVGRAILELSRKDLSEAHDAAVWLVSDDALRADDHLPLSGPLSTGPTVLLVNGAPSLQRADDELRLLSLALDTPRPDGTRLNVLRTDFDSMANADLEGADVVVLANAPAPSPAIVERLERRVEGGAGLWIGVGDMADPFAYRSTLSQLLPASPRGGADASPALVIERADPSEVAPFGSLGLTRAGTSRRWLLEDVQRPKTEVVLRFEDGTTALATAPLGKGRLALWTSSFDDDWSDVPLTPGFVALVHSVVRWLAPSATERGQPSYAGVPVPLTDESDAEAFEVVLPTGERLELAARDGRATLERTEHIGHYRVTTRHSDGSRSDDRMGFQVRVDPEESELRASASGTVNAPAQASGGSVRRGKRPVSKWVWLALGLVALLEALLRVVRVTSGPRGPRLERA